MKEIHIWKFIVFSNAYVKLGFGEEKYYLFTSKLFYFSDREIFHCIRFHLILGKIMPLLLRKSVTSFLRRMRKNTIGFLKMTKILLDIGLLHHTFMGMSKSHVNECKFMTMNVKHYILIDTVVYSRT